jgi:elongation factor G
MDKYDGAQIRNVALLSHSGAGKTSLAEAMLFQSKTISRLGKVDDGNTTSDYDPDEIRRRTSINMSVLPLEWNKTLVNLLDAPGYPDFVGEVRAAVRAAEGAIVVVCAASGVEVGTELNWKYADRDSLPRIIFVNKLDRENADFFKTFDQIEAAFGRKCVPIQLPIGAESSFEGVFDLVTGNAAEPPAQLQDRASKFRDKLLEAVAETDDELTAKYLEGEELTEEEVRRGLQAGTLSGALVPVLVGSATHAKGVEDLMNAVVAYLPSPKATGKFTATNAQSKSEESIEPDDAARLASLIFKTTADPYVGKLTYLRVYSGMLSSDSTVWNATRGHPERIGQLFRIRGKAQEPVAKIAAGDIGAIAKLSDTGTGDTLSTKEHPLILDPVEFPKPALSVAVYPKTKGDLDKLGPALSRLVEEDPTLAVHKDPVTAETVLSGMGEAHFEVAVEKMKRKFGVEVHTETPKIPYKETIMAPTKAEYKHKKQTGGHGQYGHVMLELQPLPRGSGFEFGQAVVGGSVPRNYIPAVEKGVAEAMADGVLAGYPLTDMKVTLYDGSFHAVDSSDMSFKIAGLHALKKGAAQAQPVLLEPIVSVSITIPDTYTGDVMSDLNSKRARVLGMTPGDGMNVIDAQVPLEEMLRYAIDLRSITQGRGTFTMEFSHYEEVPQHITQRLVAESKKDAEKS